MVMMRRECTGVSRRRALQPRPESIAMTLTADERAESSRRNGRLGRDPKTEEGRRRASQAARDRGLMARTVPLSQEDHRAVPDRAAMWRADLEPDTPLAHHLVNECARASVLADRYDRFLQA